MKSILSPSQYSFLSRVFLTVISQLLVTFLVVMGVSRLFPTFAPSSSGATAWWVVYVLGFFISLGIVVAITTSRSPPSTKLVWFTIFSILFGLMLAPLGSSRNITKRAVLAAVSGTLGIFVLMFLAGLILTRLRVNLSWLGWVLLASLFGLLIAELVILMCGITEKSYRTWLYVGLVIYSVFIVFDTQMILRRAYGNDYVSAALAYYLDVLGIFLRLLRLDDRS